MVPKTLRMLVRRGRNFEPTWRYLFNLRPTLSYKLNRCSLQGEAARVLSALNRDGVAMTSAEALLGPSSCFSEVCGAVEGLQASLANDITRAKAGADNPNAIGDKKFILEYLGHNPQFDPASVYARFSLEQNILGVANAYLGMQSRLRYYNVWHTFPTRIEARESQLWHRDREDFKILKVFVYLSDVDEGAGALTYARGSQLSGGMKSSPEYFVEGGVKRSKDEQMAAVVPPAKWLKATGPRGTVVFADTSGYHKGGLARERDRLMYVCMFTSPSSQSKELFSSSEPV
jgi:hypothetical protein